ncbi:hypothetical protein Tco_1267517 [Tanacetum coccineum]
MAKMGLTILYIPTNRCYGSHHTFSQWHHSSLHLIAVLDEIGVDVASQLSSAPKGKIAGKNTEDASSSGLDELEKRLAALRG